MKPDECQHASCFVQYDETAMREDFKTLSCRAFREKYPRLKTECRECGASVIAYSSHAHYVMGDW